MINKHILIVEDNPDNYELADKIIKHMGYQTTIITNGIETLEWCAKNTPDLILMDISIPNKDGLEVAKELRTNPNFNNIPIVALTAHAMKGDEDKAIEAGCTKYMSKPFRPAELKSMIGSLI